MNEIKIRSDNRVSVGANIKRIRILKGVRAFDLIRDLQLQGFTLNKDTINWNMISPIFMLLRW